MPLSRRALLAGLAAAAAGPSPVAAQINELRAQKIAARWPGWARRAVQLWTFNGTVPGPVLRARQGMEFTVRLFNELDEPLALHWHGIRLANAMDGTWLSGSAVEPGGTFDHVFTPPDSGTFWYRTTTNTAIQRERGLSGMLIVEEAEPLESSVVDIPILIDDWKIDARRAVDETSFGDPTIAAGAGRLGTIFTVNGASRPVFPVAAASFLRLRLLNAANARILRLNLGGGEAYVMAHDAQPVEPASLRGQLIELAPGQRLDLMAPPSALPLSLAAELNGRMLEIARILRRGVPRDAPLPPPRLAANPLPSYFNYAALRHATFTIEGGRGGALKEAKLAGRLLPVEALAARGYFWAVNGNAGPSSEPLFTVAAGSTVAVSVDNISRFPHALHLHGHAARLVERAGRPVADPPWRDTFIIRPLEPAKILFIADNPGRWLLASTMAEHFDSGLQAWFEVT